MKRIWLAGLAGTSVMLAAALVVLSGCGGGGGPINQPVGGNGGFSAQFLQLVKDNAPDQVNATAIGSQQCLTCHNDTVHSGWKNTVHFTKNVGCENCHGNGSVHSANRAAHIPKADMLTMPAIDNPLVCGQCHGPTHDELMSSKHAEVVDEVVNPESGVRSATCVRCHESALRNKYINVPWTAGLLAHTSVSALQTKADSDISGLSQAEMATLASFSHQTTTCVTCHEPHTPTGKTLGSGEEKQLRRITQNQDVTSVVPPVNNQTKVPPTGTAVTSNWDHICGTCHNGRTADPSDTSLAKQSSTDRPNYHEGPQFNMLSGVTGSLPPGTVVQNSSHRLAEDQCVHCHMPNNPQTQLASHTFTVNLDSSCLPCHTAADAAARAGSVRNETLSNLLVLRTAMETWAAAHMGDSRFWDYATLVFPDQTSTDYKNLSAAQPNVPIEIRRARHNYYFIVRDGSLGVHNTPYTRQLLAYSINQVNGLVNAAGRSVKVTRSLNDMKRLILQDRVRSILSERSIRPGAIQ